MASLQKTYTNEKLFGQVYTPDFIVKKMLDDTGYLGVNILGKKVLDPACGDGRFLVEVVQRILMVSPPENLVKNLECIYGWDIDENAVYKCIENLNSIVNHLDIYVDWNISQADAIFKLQLDNIFSTYNESLAFDYILGNPPYIRIQHLDLETRNYIQSNYHFCQNGSTDIYIAFFELAKSLLSPTGIAAFITPNTFFFTETAKAMRSQFRSEKSIIQITNYTDIQVFNNATTYSAITIFTKQEQSSFLYQKAISLKGFTEHRFDTSILQQSPWTFPLEKREEVHGKRLGDIAKIHVGVTTLCDKAYIFRVSHFEGNTVIAHTLLLGKIKIERDILKPIIKGSKLKNGEDEIYSFILFPYQKVNGKHKVIPESELRERFPLAYKYLLSVKEHLDNRDNGKPNAVTWYAFGRSQGLDTSFGKKIIFSPMNNRPNFILSKRDDCTFYSGYCIKYNGDYEFLLQQLNSERMRIFIEESSRDFRNGWKAYNKKIVENFIVEV